MDNVWVRHLANLKDSDSGRHLSLALALAGELFVMKAEMARLRLALAASGAVSKETLLDAGESDAFQAWMRKEQSEFATFLLKAWEKPDESPDVSGVMAEEMAQEK